MYQNNANTKDYSHDVNTHYNSTRNKLKPYTSVGTLKHSISFPAYDHIQAFRSKCCLLLAALLFHYDARAVIHTPCRAAARTLAETPQNLFNYYMKNNTQYTTFTLKTKTVFYSIRNQAELPLITLMEANCSDFQLHR
jgi:hypothetical protein